MAKGVPETEKDNANRIPDDGGMDAIDAVLNPQVSSSAVRAAVLHSVEAVARQAKERATALASASIRNKFPSPSASHVQGQPHGHVHASSSSASNGGAARSIASASEANSAQLADLL